MNNKTTEAERVLWTKMKQRMDLSKSEIPVTRERARQLQSKLPARNNNESVGEWIRRAGQLKTSSMEALKENKQLAPRKLQCLAQVIRLAADPNDADFSLPDPGWVHESEDGRWRLKIISEPNIIQLDFQALSYAVDEFANHNIIFWDEAADKPFASILLDQDGDGFCELPNTLQARKALCQPHVFIEED